MKITVLGSGSAFSDLTRFNSAYLVETGNLCFMIDCGSDALRALQKAGSDLFSIQDIFITHMHADHCGGIPAVLTAMHVLERKEPIRVHVPSGQLEFVKSWLANFFIYNERWSFRIDLVPLSPGEKKPYDDIELEFSPTNHLDRYMETALKAGINAMSFSVIVREGKKSFYFSSDIDSIEEIGSHADSTISFIEAAHPELEEIARISRKGHNNLFFTHIPQELETGGTWARELYSKFGTQKINIIHDGQIFTI
ncbi:MAG TPA: ribonuclease Z [Candidatus Acidoferrales bacterium]|nr:ribonuclease Z [Candidatus Acidoferrales bacterium]